MGVGQGGGGGEEGGWVEGVGFIVQVQVTHNRSLEIQSHSTNNILQWQMIIHKHNWQSVPIK